MKLHPTEPMHMVLEKSATVMLIVLTTALHAAVDLNNKEGWWWLDRMSRETRHNKMDIGVRSTCETRSVNAGDPVNLTCHFDQDIRKLKLDVDVNRRKPKKLNVFKCAWFNGECLVTIMPGVLLVGNISNILNLMITQANESHAGTYMCQVARSSENDTSSCTLNVSDIANGSQASVMISTEGNVSSGAATEQDQSQIKIIIVLVTLASGLLLLIIILIVLWLKRERLKEGCMKSSESASVEMSDSNSTPSSPLQTQID